MKRIKITVAIPTWALSYIANGDDGGEYMTTYEKEVINNYNIELLYPVDQEEGEWNPESYFSRTPLFGKACSVEDWVVMIDNVKELPRRKMKIGDIVYDDIFHVLVEICDIKDNEYIIWNGKKKDTRRKEELSQEG